MTIKILLVDDHPLMRKGVAQLLKLNSHFSNIYEADNGTEALALSMRFQPDLILLDLNMKGLSGLETLKALKAQGSTSKIAVLTVSDSLEDRQKLIEAGADRYFLKDSDPEVLLEQIELLVFDKLSYSALESQNKQPSNLHLLTKRELQILDLVSKGFRNKQIADNLFISEATVKVHLKNLLKKLDMDSRMSAALLYLDSGN